MSKNLKNIIKRILNESDLDWIDDIPSIEVGVCFRTFPTFTPQGWDYEDYMVVEKIIHHKYQMPFEPNESTYHNSINDIDPNEYENVTIYLKNQDGTDYIHRIQLNKIINDVESGIWKPC